MECVDCEEHFSSVETRVFVMEDARRVDQGTEVAAGDVFLRKRQSHEGSGGRENHCEVDGFFILKGVEELD